MKKFKLAFYLELLSYVLIVGWLYLFIVKQTYNFMGYDLSTELLIAGIALSIISFIIVSVKK